LAFIRPTSAPCLPLASGAVDEDDTPEKLQGLRN
jgi:hypothetical protein